MFRGTHARMTSAGPVRPGERRTRPIWPRRAGTRLAGAILLGALAITAGSVPAAVTGGRGHQPRLAQLACARGWAWNGVNAHPHGSHARAAEAVTPV